MRAYISHSIRGREGKNATDEQMRANNNRAIIFANEMTNKFPQIDFYCPGEHDEIILKAYRKGYLDEHQILECDCEIVSECDFLIAYTPDGYISAGMEREIEYAQLQGIPVFYVLNSSDAELVLVRRYLDTLLRG